MPCQTPYVFPSSFSSDQFRYTVHWLHYSCNWTVIDSFIVTVDFLIGSHFYQSVLDQDPHSVTHLIYNNKCLVLTATPRLLTKITPFTCLRCRSFHNHDHDCFITLTKFYRSLNFTKCFLLWPQPFSNFNQVPVTRSWSYASCGDSRSEKRLFGSFWNKLTTNLLCLCKMC